MRRRIKNNNHPRQNLDSFLDILTNTVGVLMFIGLFVSLLAVEAGTIIKTPLVRSEENKKPKLFEVRNNEIFYINDPELDAKVQEALTFVPYCPEPDVPKNIPDYMFNFYIDQIQEYELCLRRRSLSWENFYYDNGDYIVTLTPQGSSQYQASPSAQGDTIDQLRSGKAEFTQILQKLDPLNNYIAFIVRPDSFATFRAAREQAWKLGYDVGWEPVAEDRILVFGSSGRSIGVQ